MRGVQAYIKDNIPSALFIHCPSHLLNVCLSDACKVPGIRNCMDKCVHSFMSAKRTRVLKEAIIKYLLSESKRTKLI